MRLLPLLLLLPSCSLAAPNNDVVVLQAFQSEDARQGVAVDADYVYAINTRAISKHDKITGELKARWCAEESGLPIIHLDSGVVVDQRLYCAHSNYPHLPMTSSVEIWDATNLKHIGSHSFGIFHGSFTWLDWQDGFWWGVFAHYNKKGGYPDKDVSWTTMVKFNEDWEELESWVFPEEVLDRVKPYSLSGGSWGSKTLLCCTGHDRGETYLLEIPKAGACLKLKKTLRLGIEGQGIAFDRSTAGRLYGLLRSEKKVLTFDLSAQFKE